MTTWVISVAIWGATIYIVVRHGRRMYVMARRFEREMWLMSCSFGPWVNNNGFHDHDDTPELQEGHSDCVRLVITTIPPPYRYGWRKRKTAEPRLKDILS